MPDYFETSATRYLLKKEIPFSVFTHQAPVETLEQAARERQQTTDQVVRSILFRIDEGKYVMVLAPGLAQISWKALRQFLGISRLTMAAREEVLAATGYPIGAVSPFGLKTDIHILVDRALLKQDAVSTGSGIRGQAIIMQVSDLLKALEDYSIGSFRQSNPTSNEPA